LAIINPENREAEVKLIYYGPGRAGKTSNLKYIYNKFAKRIKGKLTSINTNGDSALFYDSLPLEIGRVKGYKGVDGVVFVADSMALRQQLNIDSLEDLKENLAIFGKNILQTPLVFQYNKRDLEEQGIPLLSYETLEKDLNSQLVAPSFEASAVTGFNVVETVKKAISLTVASLQDRL